MIYHITTKAAWEDAKNIGYFEVESVKDEGFIHMSYDHQIDGVIERYYKGVAELIVLSVDETKITAEIKYELSPSLQEKFPHIYGPINLDAVTEVNNL